MSGALEALYDRIRTLGDRAGLSTAVLPSPSNVSCEDSTWIEDRSGGDFALVYQERGVRRDVATGGAEQITFQALSSATFSVAADLELSRRRRGEDFRRQLFAIEEQLMDRIGSGWGEMSRRRHADILARHPFEDGGR